MDGSVYRLTTLARNTSFRSLKWSIRRLIFLGLFALGLSLPADVSVGADAPGNGAAGISVVSSGPDALRFSVLGLEPVWTPRIIGDPAVTLYDVSMAGFVTSGAPGHPLLPRTGGWVVVPPGTRPELKIIEEQWKSAGDRPLMVAGVPVIIQGAESRENFASEILVLPGEDPPPGAAIPAGALEALARRGRASASVAVTLGKVAWWRGRRIVSYQLVPLHHDAAGRAGQALAGGTWEIRFVPDVSAGRTIKPAHAGKSSTRNDDRFGGIFLNGELLTQLPTEAAWQGVDISPLEDADKSDLDKVRGGQAGTLLGPEARLAVWKTGLVRVTYDRLNSRGLLPTGAIREDQIRLYQRRYIASLDDGSGQVPYMDVEVPIHMVGEGDNFDGDDFFIFHGLRPRDDGSYVTDLGNGPETIPGCGDAWEMNNEANLYWLAASEAEPGQPWSRMDTTTLPAATGTLLSGYRRSDHIEEQLAFRENLPEVQADRVYYNTERATDVRAGINPLWAPDPAGSSVDIKLGIVGKYTGGVPLRFELITDSSLTTHLEDYILSSNYEVVRSYVVPASAIAGDFAEIRMYDHVYYRDPVEGFLNWVEISYDALYMATRDKITFHCGDSPGPRPVEVTGFTSADIGLVEVTDPRQPVLVELGEANITTSDDVTWTLSVMPDQSGSIRSFAAVGDFTSDGVDEFPSHLSSTVPDPTNPTDLAGPAPDLIVITHPTFRAALERWLEHRRSRAGGNLNVHVVDVEDLFDWYSGGLKDPWALKRFVTHAIIHWNSWVLTVVGDANENVLEKGVLPAARAWGRDWVPTHYHVQKALTYTPELMASDKWYVTLESGMNYPEDVFPDDVTAPWDMYTGRFPCNSVAELDIMIDKVMTVENVQAGQDWRRKGIFFADDRWSNGYGADSYDVLDYKDYEKVFAVSERDSLSRLWRSGSPVVLDSVLVLLGDTLDPEYPPPPASRDLSETRNFTGAAATPILLAKLSEGGLVAHYQGHANPYVLSSEYWLEDRNDAVGRQDVAKIGNTDKPWFFMGLGCHISDWAQNTVLTSTRSHERSISEKFLLRSRAGASATYASSGYEYITENREFGEYIFLRWMVNPPVQRSVGAPATVRSRWVLGELMWAAESDILAANTSPTIGADPTIREMVSQYVILGDPLMGLDAGEAQVTATLVGSPDQDITGEAEIFATDETNVRTVTLTARDEAGIDHIKVMDSTGQDLTTGIVTEILPPGASDHQVVDYSLQVPVRPFDHDLTVMVWDTGGALESDRHYELVLKMPQTAVFSTSGNAIDPATFIFPADTPLRFNAQVTSAAWLLDYDPNADFALTSETLTLTDIEFLLAKNQHLTVDFTATSATENADDEHTVVLTIDGYPTDLVLQAGSVAAISQTIGKVYNFPNPMRESTRFVFESGLNYGSGTIRVFSVAGRPVARIHFRFTGGGSGVVDWDGRDSAGDEMGNGTYLYRVEIDTDEGLVVSDMQRLVMMR